MSAAPRRLEVGDRCLLDCSGRLFRVTIVSQTPTHRLVKLTQRPDAQERLLCVNADAIRALPHSAPRAPVSWRYDWSAPPSTPGVETIEFVDHYGDRKWADLNLILSRRGGDARRLTREPAMTLEDARGILENEGATSFSDHGLMWVAHRPSKARPGELATAVIRWVGDGDAWEIQGGWTS